MTKLAKCLVALGLLGVLILLLVFFLFIQPFIGAETRMTGDIIITELSGGQFNIQWEPAAGADAYLLELFDGDGNQIYTSRYIDTECTLPDDLDFSSGEITIKVTSERDYKTILSSKTRAGGSPRRVTVNLSAPPVLKNTTYHVDVDTKTVTFNWQNENNTRYNLYYSINGSGLTMFKSSDSGQCIVTFGNGDDLAVPKLDEAVTIYFSAEYVGEGYTFCGRTYESVTFVRDDLLGTNLNLQCTDLGDNSYILTWEETKGDHYEVQERTSQNGQWQTVAQYGIYDVLSFSTGHLDPFTTYYLRVVAYGNETIDDTPFSAYPGEVTLETKESTIFATIWPTEDLEIYSDVAKTDTIGTAKAGKAYCVVEEISELALFRIYTEKGYGYIDSNRVMINLPDYIGNLVSYDIVNSYSALYTVHGYGIPEITGTVIVGYENVLNNTGYLAPFLYPSAKKMLSAALAMAEDGYRLKLYDTFRPYEATRFLYDQTNSIINDPVPDAYFADMTEVPWLDDDSENGETTPESEAPAEETQSEGEGTETGETAETETEPEEPPETYLSVMTNGSYSLSAFLAKNGSMHNLGVAADLTLETIDTRTELEMQTPMHDLSWNAIVAKNNANANLLARYMTEAGFGTLSSEWWHFQDNDSRKLYDIQRLTDGVSVEGWKVDDSGIRYRRADGSYISQGTHTINGTKYVFDYNGYLETEN